MAEATDPITLLAGLWSAHRHVVDLETGRAGEFRGAALFEPHNDGLRWTERGRLRFGVYDGEAGRCLAIVPAADGWMVEFDDGRPFHALDLATGAWAVEHRCGADRYAGEYVLHTHGALDVVWYVAGPHKRQVLDTAYHRLLP